MYDNSMEKLVWQMFILGTGECLNDSLELGLGGVIFFTRDIQSKEQFKDLIKSIVLKSKIYPFLSVDQEGGKVERTENIHPRYISPKYAYQRGKDFLEKQTQEIAEELKDYGINLNFAPCADVNTNPKNPIIGERSFSDKPEEVIDGVNIVSNIYRRNGIIPCIKHYPGHGDADKDSHLTLPQIDLPLEEMSRVHIEPFRQAVKSGTEMIMAAHLHCTCFDKEVLPSSLSKNAIGYLRNELGFDGVVISDDMVMKGVQQFGSLDAIIMGIEAGLDMFIFRDADRKTFDTVKQLVKIVEASDELKQKVIKSNQRIDKLKRLAL